MGNLHIKITPTTLSILRIKADESVESEKRYPLSGIGFEYTTGNSIQKSQLDPNREGHLIPELGGIASATDALAINQSLSITYLGKEILNLNIFTGGGCNDIRNMTFDYSVVTASGVDLTGTRTGSFDSARGFYAAFVTVLDAVAVSTIPKVTATTPK